MPLNTYFVEHLRWLLNYVKEIFSKKAESKKKEPEEKRENYTLTLFFFFVNPLFHNSRTTGCSLKENMEGTEPCPRRRFIVWSL